MSTPATSPSFQTWTIDKPYIHPSTPLGEAPHYEPQTHTLRFVDLKAHCLHTLPLPRSSVSQLDPNPIPIPLSNLHTLNFDVSISVTANIHGVSPQEKIIVGGKYGLYLLLRPTGKLELIKSLHDKDESGEGGKERMQCNDGTIDPEGNFIVGTMNDLSLGKSRAEGALYHVTSDLTRTTLLTNLTIPNGLAFSPSRRTLYFTHSTSRTITAYSYDPSSTPPISNPRVIYTHTTTGAPDGLCVDVEGCLWVCVFGEGRVARLRPPGGLEDTAEAIGRGVGQAEIVGEIKVPARRTTCAAFVGRELWITSAMGDEGVEGEGDEWAGGLFRVDVGVEGAEVWEFGRAGMSDAVRGLLGV